MNISDLIELERKATKGPWFADDHDAPLRNIVAGQPVRKDAQGLLIADWLGSLDWQDGISDEETEERNDANAEMLVALRNHAVALFEVVKAASVASAAHISDGLIGDHTARELAAALAKLEGVK